ncbi:Uncharacterised protein [Mycobacterium tuberculosis]|nr:Uncharacterised protein [Mycobacterium tuberculosis]
MGGARLEHGEQRDGERVGARQGERDDLFGAGARGGEPVGERLGAAVEAGVGEGGVAEDDGGPAGGPGDLLLDQRGDRPNRVLAGGPGVFDGRAEGGEPPRGVGGDLGEQLVQAVQESLDGGGVEQVGRERRESFDLVVALGEVEVEVELHAAGLREERLGANARQREAHVLQPLVDDHHLEQRAAGERALGGEPVHDPFERDTGVRERGEVGGAHPVEQLGERRVAGQVGAQDERVDEDPDKAGEVLVGAPGDGRPERDVVAGAGPLEQRGDGGVQHHEHAGPGVAGQPPDAGGREPERHEPAPVARLRRARPVERQDGLLGEAAERLRPEVELGRRIGGGLALPRRVVGVLDGQGRPGGFASVPPGLVGAGQVGEQRRERPFVGGGVVQEQDQRPVVVPGPDEGAADGQVAADVEDVRGGVPLDGRPAIGGLAPCVDDGEMRRDVRLQDVLDGQPVRPFDEQRAQRLVPGDDVGERLGQGVAVHRSVQAEAQRERVRRGRSAQPLLQPEPALRRRRRDDLGTFDVAHAHRVGGDEPGREAGDGRGLEHVRDGQLRAEGGAGLGRDAGGQQRMPAEGEEVVVDTDPADAEEFGEDGAEGGLAGVARGASGDLRLGGGQRGPVELAVDRAGQRVQGDEGGRHHVLGQRPGERVPEGRFGGAVHRDVVADEPRLAGAVLADRDGGLRDARLRGEHRLRLGRLDPEPADLHLVVGAAEVLDRPVAGAARQVARPVHAGTGRAVRVGDEPLRREPGASGVAAGELRAREVQLAGDARRDGPEAGVEDVGAGVPERPADAGRGKVGGCRPDRRLGRPVHVGRERRLRLEGPGERRGQRLAADQHPQPLEGGRVERAEQRRGALDDRGVLQQPRERGGVADGRPVGEDDRRAADQRREQLQGGDVERDRGHGDQPVARAEAELRPGEEQEVRQRSVRDRHALGTAGGTRGVDDVGELVLARFDRRFGRRRGLGLRRAVQDEEARAAGQQAGGIARDDRAQRPGVVQHGGEPVGGMVEVQRQVRGARLQDAEQRDHEVRGARQGERDDALGAGAAGAELRRERRRPLVQLGVGEGLRPRLDRRGAGSAGGLLREQRDDVRVGYRPAGGVGVLDERALLPAHDLKSADRAVGVGERVGEQGLQMDEQRVDARVVEQFAPERGLDGHALRPDERLQRQVEVRGAVVDVRPARRDSGQVEFADLLGEEEEHRVEERRPALSSRRAELPDDPVVRRRLVREVLGEGPAGAPQRLPERRRARQVGAQHQRVAEVADEPLGPGVLPVHHRRPDRHVVRAGVAVQQDRVRGEHDRVRGEVLVGGELPHAEGHGVREAPRPPPAALGHGGAARAVGGQVEGRGRRIQALPPVGEIALVGGPPLLPLGVVGVLDGRRRQPVRLAGDGRAVQGRQVAREGTPGHPVPRDVVDHEDERVVVLPEPEQLQPYRPLRAQVEGRRRQLRRPRLGVLARDGREVDRVVLADDLHRPVLDGVSGAVRIRFPGRDGSRARLRRVRVRGAEDGVAADQPAQRVPQRVRVEPPLHADEQADVVGGAVRERAVVQPHALLRVGQRRRSVRSAGGDPGIAGSQPGPGHHPPHQFAPPRRRRPHARPLVHPHDRELG